MEHQIKTLQPGRGLPLRALHVSTHTQPDSLQQAGSSVSNRNKLGHLLDNFRGLVHNGCTPHSYLAI